MSLIGSLDQLDLSIVLQRIEAYRKTGLLTVKQGERSVELSFRQGQLLCIGPVRPNISLGERLLLAGVISREAYQEVALLLGADHYREIGAALALIDLGHVNQESLYRWAMSEASQVVEALLMWPNGELYFDENQPPPTDRLLIALSVTSLIPPQTPRATSQPINAGSSVVREQLPSSSSYVSEMPTLHGEPVFFDQITAGPRVPSSSTALFATIFPQPETERNTDSLVYSTSGPLVPPQPVTSPLPPMRVNTAFMQPYMVLMPTDLSVYREENPQIQLTPDQWRLFTRTDGQTTLQMAAQELGMSPEQICQVAGELIALRLVTISAPAPGVTNELYPIPSEHVYTGVADPGVAAPPASVAGQISSAPPIETHSQWGNGGNGATFVFGYGWVVASSPSHPAQTSQPLSINSDHRAYAKAG